MPKVKGTLVAVRPRVIKTKSGEVRAYQAAYIPQGDEHGFPSVINVTDEVFGSMSSSADSGVDVTMTFIETPPYGDRLVIGFEAS